MVVNDNDEVLLINSNGIIIRIKASEVSRLGRATQGVKIMKVTEEANIISLAKVVSEDQEIEELEKLFESDSSNHKEKATIAENGEIEKEDDGQIQLELEEETSDKE